MKTEEAKTNRSPLIETKTRSRHYENLVTSALKYRIVRTLFSHVDNLNLHLGGFLQFSTWNVCASEQFVIFLSV